MKIIMMIKSERIGRNRDFVDKLHARSRGICGGRWARWFFGRMDRRIKRGKDQRSGRRRGHILCDNKE